MNWVLRTQNTRTPDWGLGTELVVRKSVQHLILLPQPWQRERDRETERETDFLAYEIQRIFVCEPGYNSGKKKKKKVMRNWWVLTKLIIWEEEEAEEMGTLH